MKKPTIAVLGSHSALDVCRGAKDEGFETLVIAEAGREQTYQKHYATRGNVGCVDSCLVLPKFSDILTPHVQRQLRKNSVVFVPNRSFEAYCHFDYEAIEKQFVSPMFGNKYLLKIEGNPINMICLAKPVFVAPNIFQIQKILTVCVW